MQLQEDEGAKSKQIWSILSHWDMDGSSFRCQRSRLLFFLQCERSACESDIVTAVIYYYTTPGYHYAKRDSPAHFRILRSVIFKTKISKFRLKELLKWAKMTINVFTRT